MIIILEAHDKSNNSWFLKCVQGSHAYIACLFIRCMECTVESTLPRLCGQVAFCALVSWRIGFPGTSRLYSFTGWQNAAFVYVLLRSDKRHRQGSFSHMRHSLSKNSLNGRPINGRKSTGVSLCSPAKFHTQKATSPFPTLLRNWESDSRYRNNILHHHPGLSLIQHNKPPVIQNPPLCYTVSATGLYFLVTQSLNLQSKCLLRC